MKSNHQTQYSNYSNDIIWFRKGEVLERSKGYGVSSYGACWLDLTLFPKVMVADEDYLDCPDTDKPSIDKIALVKVKVKVKVKQEIQKRVKWNITMM